MTSSAVWLGTAWFTANVTLVLVAKRFRSSSEGVRPAPEYVATRTRITGFQLALIVSCTFAVLFGAMAVSDYVGYRKLVALQQHGRRTDATVDSTYVRCSKHSRNCSLQAVYHYALSSLAPTVMTGRDSLGANRADNPHVVYVSATGHVPIVYDPQNPQTSAINFDDSFFRTDPALRLRSTLTILAVLVLLALALATIVAAIAARAMRRGQSAYKVA